jgi:hypothetical protein
VHGPPKVGDLELALVFFLFFGLSVGFFFKGLSVLEGCGCVLLGCALWVDGMLGGWMLGNHSIFEAQPPITSPIQA